MHGHLQPKGLRVLYVSGTPTLKDASSKAENELHLVCILIECVHCAPLYVHVRLPGQSQPGGQLPSSLHAHIQQREVRGVHAALLRYLVTC
jgi:hypothetical protein